MLDGRANLRSSGISCRRRLDHQHQLGELRQPKPTLLPYATTKGAIANFTAGLAQLLGDRGIWVNAVAPGPIWTPLIPSTMPPEQVEEFGKNTPLGRPGEPKELAPVYVLLASDEASYIILRRGAAPASG